MGMAQKIQQSLAAVGIVAHRRNNLRFGHDAVFDIERLLAKVSVIVDVGANEGQSALPFARIFGSAHVFAFEPVPETFAILTARTAREPRIECFNLALGAQEGTTTIRLAAWSGHNSLLDVAQPGPGTVSVTVTTGDAWAAAHHVEHIDLLKIDTEGYELEVLEGFDSLFAAGRVEAVLVECEFDRVTTEPHTSFFSLYEYLTKRDMGFTTLYTDALASNQFAWGNALFVRKSSGAATPLAVQ